MARVHALLTALVAVAVAGCGDGGDAPPRARAALPAPPAGMGWAQSQGFVFARPDGWRIERPEQPAGKDFAAFTGHGRTAGVTPQVGLGTGRDYPDSLADAVRLLKAENRAAYPGYRVLREGARRLRGAQGYLVEAEHDAFTERRVKVRVIDILAQTPGRTQASFFVRSAAPDFEAAGLRRIAASFDTR